MVQSQYETRSLQQVPPHGAILCVYGSRAKHLVALQAQIYVSMRRQLSRVKVVLHCHSPQVVVMPGDGDGDAVVVGLLHSPPLKVVLRGLCHSPHVVVPGDGDGDADSPRLLPRGHG